MAFGLVGDVEAQGLSLGIVACGDVAAAASDLTPEGPAVDGDGDLAPPGAVGAYAPVEVDLQARVGDAAADRLAKVGALLERHRVAVVEVERAAAVGTGVDVEGERALRSLGGALDERLARQDGSRTDEDRQALKRRGRRDGLGGGIAPREAGPVIVPASRREADVVFGGTLRVRRRGDEEVAAQCE